MQLFLIGILIMNLYSFTLMGVDKYRAKHNIYRISERSLLLSSLLFGSYGMFFGIKVFRHKTRKLLFIVSSSILMILHAFLIYYLNQLLQ